MEGDGGKKDVVRGPKRPIKEIPSAGGCLTLLHRIQLQRCVGHLVNEESLTVIELLYFGSSSSVCVIMYYAFLPLPCLRSIELICMPATPQMQPLIVHLASLPNQPERLYIPTMPY